MAVYKNPDGRTYHFRGAITLPNGKKKFYKQKRIKYTKKKDAQDAERAFRESLLHSNNNITFDELVTDFHLRWKVQNLDETTIVSHESHYKNHLKDFFGNTKLCDITPRMIEDWKSYMTNKRKSNGEPYAPRTINNAKESLSKYLTYAVSMEYIQFNPCYKVKKFVSPDELNLDPFDKHENFWELGEFQTFIECVDDEYWKQVFTLLFETGVREGELFALTWANVFFDRRVIRIRQSITSKRITKEKQQQFRVKSPKNKRSFREVDMSDNLFNLLKQRYDICKKQDGFTRNYYVFGDVRPLTRSTLARYLDKYILIAGVKRITPHGFRHSHASLLIRNKLDDTLIAERLGHTVQELRKTYAHVYDSSRSELKSVLNDIFKN